MRMEDLGRSEGYIFWLEMNKPGLEVQAEIRKFRDFVNFHKVLSISSIFAVRRQPFPRKTVYRSRFIIEACSG